MVQALLLQQAAPLLGAAGLLADLLRTTLALAAVCALLWFSLRWLARRGISGATAGPDAKLAVLARLSLEPRKNLYLVRAGKRLLLIGAGAEGSPRLVAELDPAAFEPDPSSSPPRGIPHA